MMAVGISRLPFLYADETTFLDDTDMDAGNAFGICRGV